MAARQETVEQPTAPSAESDRHALVVSNLEVVYGEVILVLRGISIVVPNGTIVALLGANGAGKTTLLRAITGLLDIHRGNVTKGVIRFDNNDITNVDPAARVSRGMAQVMEGRRIFANLTVEENLRAGAIPASDRSSIKDTFDQMLTMFPVLAKRRRETAGYLSGGEQQMLAIGRALMSRPRLLLLDEPSLGLAPMIVDQIRDVIVSVNAAGTGVMLVEQNASMALSVADHGYVMEHGRLVREGPAAELLADRNIAEFYLGGHGMGDRSYRKVKTYRRRKSWGS